MKPAQSNKSNGKKNRKCKSPVNGQNTYPNDQTYEENRKYELTRNAYTVILD